MEEKETPAPSNGAKEEGPAKGTEANNYNDTPPGKETKANKVEKVP